MQNFTNCWTLVKTGSLRTVGGLKCVVLGMVDIVNGLLNLVWLGTEPVKATKRTRTKKTTRSSR